MSRVAASGGVLLLWWHLTAAAIANWTFDTSRIYLPADSLGYSCTSDYDTVTTRLYLETGDRTPGPDTNSAMLVFTMIMIDNYTGESWQENRGVLDDTDPLRGKFRFDPGCPGLAPGYYLLQISDRTGSAVKTFRVSEFPQPYQTITGTVSAPAGIPLAWNSVALSGVTGGPSLSGWTNANGSYRIAVDRATLELCGSRMMVFVESRYCGFIAVPAFFRLDPGSGNRNEVNFSFVGASALVRGIVRSSSGPAPDIRVTIADSTHTIIAQSVSDNDGAYRIDCPPGTYLIAAEASDNDRLVFSPAAKLPVADGDTTTRDIYLSVDNMVAALPADRELQGSGVLQLIVTDSTRAMVDKGVIMVWDDKPVSTRATRPLCIFPLRKINAGLTLVGIPDRRCCISVELTGQQLGSDCRYSVFAMDRRGMRRTFDFTKNDTLRCTITLREKDRVQANWGTGSVQGTVTTGEHYRNVPIAVVMYDVDRATVERGGTVDNRGNFRIDNIPIGAYRVAAAIDTNNDKDPDVTVMADTLLTFTGKESFTGIDVAFSEKQADAGRIAGQLTGINTMSTGRRFSNRP